MTVCNLPDLPDEQRDGPLLREVPEGGQYDHGARPRVVHLAAEDLGHRGVAVSRVL